MLQMNETIVTVMKYETRQMESLNVQWRSYCFSIPLEDVIAKKPTLYRSFDGMLMQILDHIHYERKWNNNTNCVTKASYDKTPNIQERSIASGMNEILKLNSNMLVSTKVDGQCNTMDGSMHGLMFSSSQERILQPIAVATTGPTAWISNDRDQ
jgi:hypothetical protein